MILLLHLIVLSWQASRKIGEDFSTKSTGTGYVTFGCMLKKRRYLLIMYCYKIVLDEAVSNATLRFLNLLINTAQHQKPFFSNHLSGDCIEGTV